jgi:hypothetical protein
MNSPVVEQVERADEIPVVFHVLIKMGVAERIDRFWPTHGNWKRLSYGQLAVLFITYMIHSLSHRQDGPRRDRRISAGGSVRASVREETEAGGGGGSGNHNGDNLLRTWHPTTRPETLDFSTEHGQWLGLKGVRAVAGRAEDEQGTVDCPEAADIGQRRCQRLSVLVIRRTVRHQQGRRNQHCGADQL